MKLLNTRSQVMRENEYILDLKSKIPPNIEGLIYLKTITIGIPYVRMKLNITTRREYLLPLAQEMVLRLLEQKWTNYDEISQVLGIDKDYLDKILLELGVADYISHMGKLISLTDAGRKVLLGLKSIRIEPDFMDSVYFNMLTGEIVKDESMMRSKMRNRSKCMVYLNNIKDLNGDFLTTYEHEIRELYNIRIRDNRDRYMDDETVGMDELYRVISIEDFDRVYEQIPVHVYYSRDTDNLAFELISSDNKDLYHTCLRDQMKNHPKSCDEMYDTWEHKQRIKSKNTFKWYPEEAYDIQTLENKRFEFVTHLQSSSVDTDQIYNSYFTDRLMIYQEYQDILRSLTQKKPREVTIITDNLYMLEKSEYSLLALIEAISQHSAIYIGHGDRSNSVVSKIKEKSNIKTVFSKEFPDIRGTRIIVDGDYMLTIQHKPFHLRGECFLQEIGILTYNSAHINLIKDLFPDIAPSKE